MTNDDEIRKLLDDSDQALRQWYISVTPTKNPELVLTGGAGPSSSRMREIFDGWVARRRDALRTIICEDLGYSKLSRKARQISEISIVASVSSALAVSPWKDQIDPLATAAILVSTRALDTLCPPTAAKGPEETE